MSISYKKVTISGHPNVTTSQKSAYFFCSGNIAILNVQQGESLIFTKQEVTKMALANIEAWNEGKQTGGTSCGTACGASDK